MTSSQKRIPKCFGKSEHGQIHSRFQGVLVIAKALPVRKGYRRDVTGERLLARSLATMLKDRSVATV